MCIHPFLLAHGNTMCPAPLSSHHSDFSIMIYFILDLGDKISPFSFKLLIRAFGLLITSTSKQLRYPYLHLGFNFTGYTQVMATLTRSHSKTSFQPEPECIPIKDTYFGVLMLQGHHEEKTILDLGEVAHLGYQCKYSASKTLLLRKTIYEDKAIHLAFS